MELCKYYSTTIKFCRTSHGPTKDGSLSYKCRVNKCGVTIKIKDDEVLNKSTQSIRYHG